MEAPGPGEGQMGRRKGLWIWLEKTDSYGAGRDAGFGYKRGNVVDEGGIEN